MLTESRLVYLIIYVNDLKISRAFYEQVLGYQVLEEDAGSAKYDAGHIILLLNRAQDYGITLPAPPDRSAGVTFLVDDLEGRRTALEKRGVVFAPTLKDETGASAAFYDPDGRRFSLYEPSEQAMTWPSGVKLRAVSNTNGGSTTGAASSAPAAPSDGETDDFRLDGQNLIYLFLFVRDPKKTFEFYHDILGLRNIEGGPSQHSLTMDGDGVVKYDAGGTILATRPVDDAHATEQDLDPAGMWGIAPVFHVTNIQQAVRELSSKGVRFSYGPARSEIGSIARFEDPGGHVFYLYEPSVEALDWPSGAKIKQILAASL